jgi:hypothetical protein
MGFDLINMGRGLLIGLGAVHSANPNDISNEMQT